MYDIVYNRRNGSFSIYVDGALVREGYDLTDEEREEISSSRTNHLEVDRAEDMPELLSEL